MKIHVACLMLLAGSPALSISHLSAQEIAPELKACEILAGNDSWTIRTQLSTFSEDVLGRKTLDWSSRDFDRVAQAAKGCDGYYSKKAMRAVYAKDWEDQMLAARNFVMPVVDGFQQAVKQANETPRDLFKVPQCPKLLDWRFENKTFASNAREIFGAGLFELSSRDLRAISRFASDCGNSLAVFAVGRFQIPQERTITIVSRIVEVANTVGNAKDEYDKSPKRPNDVVAMIDGSPIPPMLAHERMQTVIRRFNQMNIRGGGMSSEGITELQQGIEAVLNRSDISSLDQAFADAIRARINADIFNLGGADSKIR